MLDQNEKGVSVERDMMNEFRWSTVPILSEFEKEFLEELNIYERVIAATLLIPHNQHGIDTDGREYGAPESSRGKRWSPLAYDEYYRVLPSRHTENMNSGTFARLRRYQEAS